MPVNKPVVMQVRQGVNDRRKHLFDFACSQSARWKHLCEILFCKVRNNVNGGLTTNFALPCVEYLNKVGMRKCPAEHQARELSLCMLRLDGDQFDGRGLWPVHP